MNLSVNALRKVTVNGVEVVDRPGIYENHRLKLWKVRETLKVGTVNEIEVEYYQMYNNNRVGLHNF